MLNRTIAGPPCGNKRGRMAPERAQAAATLDDPRVLAERLAAVDRPPMRALNHFVVGLRERRGAVPWFDPFDGGTAARVLLLLETPGPGAAPLRFVSRDNATGTARNLWRFFDAAGLDRCDSVIWNAVPWVIHAAGARNRAPRTGEVAAGLAELPALLPLLPGLSTVVLAGRAAAQAVPTLAACAPHLRVLAMPHPSPTFVCTDPGIAPRIVAVLSEARAGLSA